MKSEIKILQVGESEGSPFSFQRLFLTLICLEAEVKYTQTILDFNLLKVDHRSSPQRHRMLSCHQSKLVLSKDSNSRCLLRTAKEVFFQRVDPARLKHSDSEPIKYNQYRKSSLTELDPKYKFILCLIEYLNSEENYLASISAEEVQALSHNPIILDVHLILLSGISHI